MVSFFLNIKMFIALLFELLKCLLLSGGPPHVGAGGPTEPHPRPGHRHRGGQAARASRYCVIWKQCQTFAVLYYF